MTEKIFAVLLTLFFGQAHAGTLNFTWDHDPSDGTTEYRLYAAPVGQEFTDTYIAVSPAPSGTVHGTAIPSPTEDTQYTVTAANATAESEYSNIVVFDYRGKPMNLQFIFKKK